MVCVGLQQFAEFAAFLSVPASSRKFRRLATNQKVGSSNLSGRATYSFPIFHLHDVFVSSFSRRTEALETFGCLWREAGTVRPDRSSKILQTVVSIGPAGLGGGFFGHMQAEQPQPSGPHGTKTQSLSTFGGLSAYKGA